MVYKNIVQQLVRAISKEFKGKSSHLLLIIVRELLRSRKDNYGKK